MVSEENPFSYFTSWEEILLQHFGRSVTHLCRGRWGKLVHRGKLRQIQ